MTKSFFLQNFRFYAPKPEAIGCMSLNEGDHLAVARLDGSIEIWNVQDAPYILKTIASNTENNSIQELAWFGERLFSVGLHGFIVEYDLIKCSILRQSVVTGEAAYCLDVHAGKEQIAVGTQNGYLNIFDIKDNSLTFSKFLDKQEGPILCLSFHSSGLIASGGLDAIRIWNIETGHAIHCMSTGRSEANKSTVVWCLAFTENLTLISGDSRGKLTFWDAKVGAQFESFQSHKADILSLCLSKDQTILYCSGTDPTISCFAKIEVKGGEEKWVRSLHKKCGDHDVRSLVLNDGKLFAGGSSTYLTKCSEDLKKLVQYPPVLQNPAITLSKKARLALLRHPRHIEIWTLAKCTTDASNEQPKKIMILQRIVKNHEKNPMKEGIIFATISNNGLWIAYGTRQGLKIFQFVYEEGEEPKLLRVEKTEDTNQIHLNAVFTPDNSQLVAVCPGQGIVVYELSNDSVGVTQKLVAKELHDTIAILKISSDGRYLVAADTSSNIVLWQQESEGCWKYLCNLPQYYCPPVCLDIHSQKHLMIVSYSNNKIIEYDIRNREFTKLTKHVNTCLPYGWSTRFFPIRNILYIERSDKILLHDDNTIMAIEKNGDIQRKHKKMKTDEEENEVGYNFKVVKKYKHLVHLEMVSEEEILAVEMDPIKLQSHLPPVLVMNKFGTK